jgi:predicted acyltransferase
VGNPTLKQTFRIQEKERLLSLDVFRGLAVIGMLMVDFPGSWATRFDIFNHAQWLGITLPDFIFPSFIFIMGVALTFSFQARKIQGVSATQLHLTLLRRFIILFILGYILNYCWDGGPIIFSQMRLLGVLQRIGIVYLVVSLSYLHLSLRQMVYLGVAVLLAYWSVMTLVPVPGFGPPDLAKYPDGIVPNLATWVDKTFLGAMAWKETRPYDPEGILSTFPAISTAIIGVVTGRWLQKQISKEEKTNQIFVYGVLLTVIGYAWSLTFPLSKKLWTSSFVLFGGGWSLLLFASLFWLIDVQKKAKFIAFPRYYGMNAISAIFLCTVFDNILSRIPIGEIGLKDYLNDHLFRTWLSDRNASWVYSIVFICLFGLLFRCFYKQKWFIRV